MNKLVRIIEAKLIEEKRLCIERADEAKAISPCTEESVKDFEDEVGFMCGLSKSIELLREEISNDLIKRVNLKLASKRYDTDKLTKSEEQDIYLLICHDTKNKEIEDLISYVDEEY
jgi:hypothetical protein